MANQGDYEVNIPEYSDVADIQKAFNLYHYGSETYNPSGALIPGSVANFLDDVLSALSQAQNRLSVVPPLDVEDNLNDILTNGIYLSVDSPTTTRNYPSSSRGILSVISDTNITLTFQTYQTVSPSNNFWWRTGSLVAGNRTWSSWSQASKVGHTHNDLYYERDQIDSKIDPSITPETVAIVDIDGQIISSDITPYELAQLSGINGNIYELLDDKSPKSHDHNDIYYTKSEQPRIYVQSSTPDDASVGDLWFY